MQGRLHPRGTGKLCISGQKACGQFKQNTSWKGWGIPAHILPQIAIKDTDAITKMSWNFVAAAKTATIDTTLVTDVCHNNRRNVVKKQILSMYTIQPEVSQ